MAPSPVKSGTETNMDVDYVIVFEVGDSSGFMLSLANFW